MQLPGGELFLEGLIDVLLALNAIFANEFATDDECLEMLAITVQRKMLADHAGEDELLDLIGMHKVFRPSVSSPA